MSRKKKPRKKSRRRTHNEIGESMLAALERQLADQKVHQTLVLQKVTALSVDQGTSLGRIANALERIAVVAESQEAARREKPTRDA